ncbi:hypothetical protein E2P81_ATG08201 [Venturia nashicola]|uniref:Uncharacterized protein n=1 Tax=Venturia nashicola TaxID=86259 RepID=A0A4Z1P4I8_9PEZI|nr:hypothetical protein E6O75_ATG08383 [Venturia nashicola]TLD21613.1 hypothetical protein E2P81_ATG08201 [Venturia nashicola]
MKFTIITTLFLAAGAADAGGPPAPPPPPGGYLTCSQETARPAGICKAHLADNSVYTAIHAQACRDIHPCKNSGNGCMMNVQHTTGADGGWWADCSG